MPGLYREATAPAAGEGISPLVQISIKKKRGGRAFFFLLFIISCCMLSLHIITFPQGYVGALDKTKHQILIKQTCA